MNHSPGGIPGLGRVTDSPMWRNINWASVRIRPLYHAPLSHAASPPFMAAAVRCARSTNVPFSRQPFLLWQRRSHREAASITRFQRAISADTKYQRITRADPRYPIFITSASLFSGLVLLRLAAREGLPRPIDQTMPIASRLSIFSRWRCPFLYALRRFPIQLPRQMPSGVQYFIGTFKSPLGW